MVSLSHVFGDLHASQSFTDRDTADTETIGEFFDQQRLEFFKTS